MLTKKTKFKETEIGVIPESWDVCSIEKALNIIDGDRGVNYPSGTDFSTEGYCLFLNAKNVIGSTFDFSNCQFISKEKDLELRKGKMQRGDFALTTRGTVGNIAFYDKSVHFENIRINSGMVILRNDKNFDSKYLFQLLKSSIIKKQILGLTTGSAQPQLPIRDLKNIKLIKPTFFEQQKIAEILSSLDDKIELNLKINDNLEKIANLLFKRWFIDFEFPDKNGKPYKSSGGKMIDSDFGKIPKIFTVDAIGNQLKTILGGTPSRSVSDYWENGFIPWINSGAINNFPVLEQSEFITVDALKNSAAKLMPVKTVILPFVISVGKPVNISILGIEASGNQSVLGLLANENISAEYIYYWINSIKDKIYSCATGGAQQHINKSNVDESIIIIPTKDVIDNFNKIAKPIFDSIILNSKESLKLSKLRDALLPKLMSGKIRVK